MATNLSNQADLPVAIGDVLAGKYRVDAVLGVGGMGIVVAATHLQLQQKVALKFLLPSAIQSPEAVERFLREARAAVRLKSEHVAKVTDVGTLESGAPYMVMEFLLGADLSHVMAERGLLPVSEGVSFVMQACEAIAEAHSLGIVHRDLKPQNLFVTRKVDGRPLIKVLDFGISKSTDTQTGLSLTRTSSIMGSPLYMSPEQMRSSKNVDQRSDIWALGVVLYEVITGRVPFEAESVPELCLKVVQDQPDAPKALRAEIQEGLSTVILRCLEKEPARRFQNVAELAEALEPYAQEGSRGSAERVAMTLQVPSRPPMVSIPASGESARNPKVGTGGTAWGATQAIPAARKRNLALAAVGAVVVLGLGAVGIAKLASGGEASAANVSSSTPQPTPPIPAATAPTTTITTPSATAPAITASVTAATTAPVPTVKVTGTKPGATAVASAAPKKDGGTPSTAVTAPPRTFE